jgi:hypothetical protein
MRSGEIQPEAEAVPRAERRVAHVAVLLLGLCSLLSAIFTLNCFFVMLDYRRGIISVPSTVTLLLATILVRRRKGLGYSLGVIGGCVGLAMMVYLAFAKYDGTETGFATYGVAVAACIFGLNRSNVRRPVVTADRNSE